MTSVQPLARVPYVVLFDLKPLNKDGNWQVGMYCMHARKGTSKAPEHTSEYVKSLNFLGACPQTPLTQYGPHFLYLPWAPTILSVALLGDTNSIATIVHSSCYISAREILYVVFNHMQPFSANVESEDSRLYSEVPPVPATDATGAGHPDVVVAPPLPDTAEHAGKLTTFKPTVIMSLL